MEVIGGRGGFDAVWFDQEHVGLTIPQIEEAARAARGVGLDSFVRLNATDYATVMRPLEVAHRRRHGVDGAKRPPSGRNRFLGQVPSARLSRRQRYGRRRSLRSDARRRILPPWANAESIVAVQIEHIDAVEDVEPHRGRDRTSIFLFIGPADLSQSMGIPGEWEHPRIAGLPWSRTAKDAASANRVPWDGILPRDADHGGRCH